MPRLRNCLIMLLLITFILSSCAHDELTDSRGSIVGGGIAVYKYNNNIYYVSAQRVDEYEYEDHKICMYDGDKTTTVAEPDGAVSSLFANDDMFYYACSDGSGHAIISKELSTNEISELFYVDGGSYSGDECIYTENNRDIYFFSRTHGLWRYAGGSAEKILDAVACTFAKNHIYYSNDEGLFRADLKGNHEKLLISIEDIFEENPDSRILRVLGDGRIYNITYYKGEIYFLVADIISPMTNGGIFKLNREDNRVVPVLDSNKYVCNRFYIENDTIYFSGYSRTIEEDGLFKSDFDGNAERVADLHKFFYANDGVYFYETDLSDFKMIEDI